MCRYGILVEISISNVFHLSYCLSIILPLLISKNTFGPFCFLGSSFPWFYQEELLMLL